MRFIEILMEKRIRFREDSCTAPELSPLSSVHRGTGFSPP